MSGVPESTVAFTVLTAVPAMVPMIENPATIPGVPTGTPFASHTRNFAGTMLPCLKTLVPAGAMGGKIWCPGSPLQEPVEAYRI